MPDDKLALAEQTLPADSAENPFSETPSPRGASAPAADPPPQPATPPRDPETGRFVPQTPKHNSYWLRRAQEIGLGDEDIAALDPAELQAEVRHREIWTVAHLRGQLPPATTPAPTPEPKDDFALPDFLDDAVKGVIRALHDRIRRLEGETGTLKQRDQLRAQSESERVLDAAFEALPQHERLFGKGSAADLQGTPELNRRIAIVRAAGIEPSDAPATIRKKIAAAAGLWATPANAYEQPVAPPVSERERQWAEGGVERPTSRSTPPEPNSIAAAKKTFREGYSAIAQRNGDADQPAEW